MLFWDVVRQFNAVVGPSCLEIVRIATLVNSQVACEIAGLDHVYILSEDLVTRYLQPAAASARIFRAIHLLACRRTQAAIFR